MRKSLITVLILLFAVVHSATATRVGMNAADTMAISQSAVLAIDNNVDLLSASSDHAVVSKLDRTEDGSTGGSHCLADCVLAFSTHTVSLLRSINSHEHPTIQQLFDHESSSRRPPPKQV